MNHAPMRVLAVATTFDPRRACCHRCVVRTLYDRHHDLFFAAETTDHPDRCVFSDRSLWRRGCDRVAPAEAAGAKRSREHATSNDHAVRKSS